MEKNRLAGEQSPYLLQHAGNPVDWWPWCDQAFDSARKLDKPVFLSVGYATCHWCHVMERESFSNPEAAGLLNDSFVCIKVDREQRPDVDAVFMAACQVLGASCGWPLTVIMTPDKEPFFAATYLPRTESFGRPGLMEISRKIAKLWHDEKQMVITTAAQVAQVLARSFSFAEIGGKLEPAILQRACRHLEGAFDRERGGFNAAPKFPMAHRLVFLLRRASLGGNRQHGQMAAKTLEAMRKGGIWDHVGFGFHRYSTDADWILPHFEKMLYDQALLAMAYLEAYQVTGRRLWARTAGEIFNYTLSKMTSDQGGFYTAMDADSQGQEGRYYLWSLEEFAAVAKDDSDLGWQDIFNLRPKGNFAHQMSGSQGLNVLYLTRCWRQWADRLGLLREELDKKWEGLRRRLHLVREKRPAPLTDDKILADWNGLMIAALAMGARVLGTSAYADAARRATGFIFSEMTTAKAGLLHCHFHGQTGGQGFASDYAFFIAGLLELYRCTFELEYLEKAVALQTRMDELFYDSKDGGYFLVPYTDTGLPVLPKDLYDGALPSVNSVALCNLVQLERLTQKGGFGERARHLSRAFAGEVRRQPVSFTNFLNGLELSWQPPVQVVVVAETHDDQVKIVMDQVNAAYFPGLAVLLKTRQNRAGLEALAPFTSRLETGGARPEIYLIHGGQVSTIKAGDKELTTALERLWRSFSTWRQSPG